MGQHVGHSYAHTLTHTLRWIRRREQRLQGTLASVSSDRPASDRPASDRPAPIGLLQSAAAYCCLGADGSRDAHGPSRAALPPASKRHATCHRPCPLVRRPAPLGRSLPVALPRHWPRGTALVRRCVRHTYEFQVILIQDATVA